MIMTLAIACEVHNFTMYRALIILAVSHGCLNSLVTTIVFKPYRQGLLKAAKRLLPARLGNGVELLASSTGAKSGVYSSDRPAGKSLILTCCGRFPSESKHGKVQERTFCSE